MAAEMWLRGAALGDPGRAAFGLGACGLVRDTEAGVGDCEACAAACSYSNPRCERRAA